MPRVKVHRNRFTLPEELRRACHVADEDYVADEVGEDGILLRPSREARRRAALERIHKAQAGVRYLGPEPRPSPEDEERLIAEMLKADEAEEAAAKGSHG